MAESDPWIAGMTVRHASLDDPSTQAIRVGPWVVPRKFRANVNHSSLPLEVDLEIEVDEETREVRSQQLICTDHQPGRGVTGAKLRQLPVDRIVRAALAMAAETEEGWSVDWLPGGARKFLQTYTTADTTARWSITDELLEDVARVYNEAVGRRDPRPVWAVAEHFRRPRPTAARWVAAARDKEGLITTGGRKPRKKTRKGTTK